MVGKRTLAFGLLLALVWILMISSFAAYYYLQNEIYAQQLSENQESLRSISSSYNRLMSKYNDLGSEYSSLYGVYLFSMDTDFSSQREPLGTLIENLGANYSSLLAEQRELNETYRVLQEIYQESFLKSENVTKEDFGSVLQQFFELLDLLTLRELSVTVSNVVTLTVDLSIDYGNGTVQWWNGTEMLPGSSLFLLIQKVASIRYTYYSSSKPGHVLLDSINGKEPYVAPDFSEGWNWVWYQWNKLEKTWIPGKVGCDAWMLENDGIYEWKYEYWHFP